MASNTIVIFLTDNGPAQVRFNAGLRGWKGSVYDGGIRVPCYIRWPGHLPAGGEVDRIAAHIDLVPTLLDACGVTASGRVTLRRQEPASVAQGNPDAPGWPDRTLFFQWHRGDVPELGRAFAARSQRFKLLRHEPVPGAPKTPPLELYDMERDPLELHDIATKHPETLIKMYDEYKTWFHDVSSTRGYQPVRIALGSPRENPTILTRQDWRGPRAGESPGELGYWEVDVVQPGRFDITLHVIPRPFPTRAHVAFGAAHSEQDLEPDGVGLRVSCHRAARRTRATGSLGFGQQDHRRRVQSDGHSIFEMTPVTAKQLIDGWTIVQKIISGNKSMKPRAFAIGSTIVVTIVVGALVVLAVRSPLRTTFILDAWTSRR